MNTKDFIDLNRTFYQLSSKYTDSKDTDDVDIKEAIGLRIGDTCDWDSLLKEQRIILLSEAGSGKTVEIYQAAQRLRSEGEQAFFLRLEHISADFDSSFEVGNSEEFETWLSSNGNGWILLDSIDEARLKSAKDFETAIRILSNKISPAIERSHILITGRVNAWRPKTDLLFCNDKFPLKLGAEKNNSKNAKSDFKVYSLTDLGTEQIRIFANHKDVNDVNRFLDDIEKHDALVYTTRPQDLEEILEYWKNNNTIGTRLQLIKHSIKRRLAERDQNRADSDSMTQTEVRKGAKCLAAVATMTNTSTINVPDGNKKNEGINSISVLPEWNDRSCISLLGRPIFDDAIYGCVRFHHRSVREYLTAEWLHDKLKNGGSRRNIENLFFKEQYGLKVICPSMKSVLSWLVILDEKIRLKAFEIEPEIFLEGGDPSSLPSHLRRKILKSVCSKIATNSHNKSVTDYASVQRFSHLDMGKEIKELIHEYKDNSEILSFLLRMVWQGRIHDVRVETKAVALDVNIDKYPRIAAIRAIKEIGTEDDCNEILQSVLSESDVLDRRLLSSLVDILTNTKESINWIIEASKQAEKKEKYVLDTFGSSLKEFIWDLPPELIFYFIKSASVLLNRTPLIEQSFCKISEEFQWLVSCCIMGIERLIQERSKNALHNICLSILINSYHLKRYGMLDNDSEIKNLESLIQKWKELKYALFWHCIREYRKHLVKTSKNGRVTEYWRVPVWGGYGKFDANDFEKVKQDISVLDFLDDRLISLSLAFEIYVDNGRLRKWREALKKNVKGENELETKLNELLHPRQTEDQKKWRIKEAKWKKQDKRRKEKTEKDLQDWVSWLNANYDSLRNSEYIKSGRVTNAQDYLRYRMNELSEDNSSKWACGNWEGLIDTYGEKVAKAFRDGLVKFWRNYNPELRSEKNNEKGVPLAVIVGLSGLTIESNENKNWLHELNENEVKIACKYAFEELNGFPAWFHRLYQAFPDIIRNLVIRELQWEVKHTSSESDSFYMLNKVSWNAQWLHNDIGRALFDLLKREPSNLKNLKHALEIIQKGSSVTDNQLESLSRRKCKTLKNRANLAYWYAVWVGVNAEKALKSLGEYLNSIADSAGATHFAMSFITVLIGERGESSASRTSYKTPKALKELYLLMLKYIRVEEDLNRAGQGVYSPGLRDNSQDARNMILVFLKEISGKESFLALHELSEHHPKEDTRIWIKQQAKNKAELDSETSPISPASFLEFNKHLEFKPTNNRELFELACMRLWDLQNDLEQGDSSNALILRKVTEETQMRTYIGNWCREKSTGKYSIHQEEEFADGKRSDLRFQGNGFDAPVPVELKLADNNWSISKLYERLENQLCGDYLRDSRSAYGIFLLVYRGQQKTWKMPDKSRNIIFTELLDELRNHWGMISENYPNILQIEIIGIDLTKR